MKYKPVWFTKQLRQLKVRIAPSGQSWPSRVQFVQQTDSKIDPGGYAPDRLLLNKVLQRPLSPEALTVFDGIVDQLHERLALLKNPPQRIMDLGAGDGRHLQILRKQYPHATVVGVDLSLQRLKRSLINQRFWQKRPLLACVDASEALPFAKDSFELIVSNMLLPWIFEPAALMAEINRVLITDGVLFLSTAGPDTLIELRRAWAEVDDCLHVNAFMDMHDVGDLMLKAGITDPVMDTQRLTLTYSSLDSLLSELIGLGLINVLNGRRKGLTAASVKRRLAKHYPLNDQGGVSATLELVIAHGWSGEVKPPRGEYHFPLDRLRRR